MGWWHHNDPMVGQLVGLCPGGSAVYTSSFTKGLPTGMRSYDERCSS
jgi:hypothetical protein